jgi:hypothetical protein
MKHQAIYELYPDVVTVDDECGAFDKNGNKVEIDSELVKKTQLEIFNKKAYFYQRAMAYPSITEQLDMIYHGGIEQWKAKINEIKKQFPKP